MSSIDKAETQLERLPLGEDIAANGPGDLVYLATVFAQLNLPYRDPKDAPYWRRVNGTRTLTIRPAVLTRRDGSVDVVYPFGTVPRLFLIWLCTEVVQNKTKTIALGTSMNDFLKLLGMNVNGRDAKRVKEQVLRLLNCTMSIEEPLESADRWGLRGKNFNVASDYELWFSNQDQVGQEPLFGSSVTLTDDFHSAVAKSGPLSMAVVQRLRSSPVQLDIYVWLVNRLYRVTKPQKVTWKQLQNQFGGSYQQTRYFKRDFIHNLEMVMPLYVGAQVKIEADGLMLYRPKKHIPKSKAAKALPRD